MQVVALASAIASNMVLHGMYNMDTDVDKKVCSLVDLDDPGAAKQHTVLQPASLHCYNNIHEKRWLCRDVACQLACMPCRAAFVLNFGKLGSIDSAQIFNCSNHSVALNG